MNSSRPAHECDQDLTAIRRAAGACYLALRTESSAPLAAIGEVPEELLARFALDGTFANLCVRHQLACSQGLVIRGMELAGANTLRWRALEGLAGILHEKGFDPVLFKGGVIHARWPELRDIRALQDYDLIVPQSQLDSLLALLASEGFEILDAGSALTHRLTKAVTVRKGSGLRFQMLDIHARVTEPPVCLSLTRSILATTERASGFRVPDIPDCVCMIALHVVRSGMYRPLREYIDLLWYVDGMTQDQWAAIVARAQLHHLLPALFLSLRQALYCLALEELDPPRAHALQARIRQLETRLGRLRIHLLGWLAPPDYPLHPNQRRNRPAFRRSLILGAGTSSLWRVIATFCLYGSSRLTEKLWLGDRCPAPH